MRFSAIPLLLMALAACSDSQSVMDALPNSSIAGAEREDMPETRLESAIARPVTIGEDGPRLDACGATGVVRGPGADGALDLRAAPFAGAQRIATLAEGRRVHVCTRSIDQRWLGVVVQPAAPEPAAEKAADNGMEGAAEAPKAADCGVSRPVEAKRAYDGPCESGWVSSAFVRLVGG
ncbi:hypothetical protein KFK14_02310 [Sphingobium phenoxybenzoativorans]|uniref:SH3 domain-containing protein n=1 Tax=Sphingobium phenoxybenzoativorans TaxID=1592790 RepID=A0A975K7Q9_9SPHN|nr:hypothetical protein [Sphingobium phenoxybenzoativorans]QUT06336.1 hypothetical protein KFK14_02310 [Sphingobium phenoxybenzoativorans]